MVAQQQCKRDEENVLEKEYEKTVERLKEELQQGKAENLDLLQVYTHIHIILGIDKYTDCLFYKDRSLYVYPMRSWGWKASRYLQKTNAGSVCVFIFILQNNL